MNEGTFLFQEIQLAFDSLLRCTYACCTALLQVTLQTLKPHYIFLATGIPFNFEKLIPEEMTNGFIIKIFCFFLRCCIVHLTCVSDTRSCRFLSF